ncbi:hypothetical protein DFH07DRAFT_964001 [Mycena maculata]|uniref:Uncharacterized protein n=1 Tax=Mycena maculata TaxID=230809 RepID=A0AAD7N4F2_9AGAR|nr:hypothetical protein DFH07DRAFT_964001 [Mycena maculata]
MDSANATPTPQTACPSTPALVVEIPRDEFPPLEAPAATVTKPRAKTAKGRGKKKAEAVTNDKEDPFLAADIACATAALISREICETSNFTNACHSALIQWLA